jgi:3-oxoacid CoA-transferase subunit A
MNFAPAMSAASTVAVVQVEQVVELGQIDPGRVDTPGIHIDRVIHVPHPKYVDKEA